MGTVEGRIVDMEFIDVFDEQLAKVGPPAIFTLNHDGRLQFDLFRSRDISRQNPNASVLQWCHCVYIDNSTQWPQYILATSPQLCLKHERARIEILDSYKEALCRVEVLKELCYQKGASC